MYIINFHVECSRQYSHNEANNIHLMQFSQLSYQLSPSLHITFAFNSHSNAHVKIQYNTECPSLSSHINIFHTCYSYSFISTSVWVIQYPCLFMSVVSCYPSWLSVHLAAPLYLSRHFLLRHYSSHAPVWHLWWFFIIDTVPARSDRSRYKLPVHGSPQGPNCVACVLVSLGNVRCNYLIICRVDSTWGQQLSYVRNWLVSLLSPCWVGEGLKTFFTGARTSSRGPAQTFW